jgi:hypothetical protein
LLVEFDVVSSEGIADRTIIDRERFAVIHQRFDFVCFGLRQISLLLENEALPLKCRDQISSVRHRVYAS